MGIQDVCTPQIMWVEEQRAHVGTIYFCLFHIQMVPPYGPQGQPGTRAHWVMTDRAHQYCVAVTLVLPR